MTNFISQSKYQDELKGFGALLFSTLLYGFWGVLVRTANESSSPAFVQATFRTSVMTIVLLLIVLYQKKFLKIPTPKHAMLFGLRSLIGTISFACSYFGFIYLPIATGYVFFYTGFIIGGFIMGKFIFKEKMSGVKYLSLVLATIGVILTYSFQVNSAILSKFGTLAFIAGVLSSVWSSFPKLIPSKYSDTEVGLFDSFFAVTFVFIISRIFAEPIIFPTGNEWYFQAIFIITAIVSGQLMIFGFKKIEAQVGSIIMLLEIVFAGVLGFLFYSEVPKWFTIAGSLFIMVGSALPILYDKFRVKNSS